MSSPRWRPGQSGFRILILPFLTVCCRRGLPSPSVKWVHVFLWTFTRNIQNYPVGPQLGSRNKWLLLLLLFEEGCQLQECPDPPAVKPQGERVSQASWLGQEGQGRGVGHRSLNTRPSQEKHLLRQHRLGNSRQEATSQSTQLWPVFGGYAWELSWPGQAARPWEGGPLFGPWPGSTCY